jgi:hypothetical protein
MTGTTPIRFSFKSNLDQQWARGVGLGVNLRGNT